MGSEQGRSEAARGGGARVEDGRCAFYSPRTEDGPREKGGGRRSGGPHRGILDHLNGWAHRPHVEVSK
jgi:hypothetical protein